MGCLEEDNQTYDAWKSRLRNSIRWLLFWWKSLRKTTGIVHHCWGPNKRRCKEFVRIGGRMLKRGRTFEERRERVFHVGIGVFNTLRLLPTEVISAPRHAGRHPNPMKRPALSLESSKTMKSAATSIRPSHVRKGTSVIRGKIPRLILHLDVHHPMFAMSPSCPSTTS